MHLENSLTFIPGKVFSISQLVRVTALSQLGKLVPLPLDLPVLQVAHFILWGQVNSQVWAGHCESESPQGQEHTGVAETLLWPWVRIKSVLAVTGDDSASLRKGRGSHRVPKVKSELSRARGCRGRDGRELILPSPMTNPSLPGQQGHIGEETENVTTPD